MGWTEPFIEKVKAGLSQRRCAVCGRVIERGLFGQVCPGCQADIRNNEKPGCLICLEPLKDAPVPRICPDCSKSPHSWERAACIGLYMGVIKDLILRLKFGGDVSSATVLGIEMARASKRLRPFDCLVPVPLHRNRLIKRGYNQSLELAKQIAKGLGCPVVFNALIRHRYTNPQTGLGRSARLNNLSGSMAVVSDIFKNRSVLLVDDVMTTGTTLEECAGILRCAGAASVQVLLAAKAVI